MTEPIVIRNSEAAETSQICQLLGETLPCDSWWNFPPAVLSRKLLMDDSMIFVAEFQGRIAGCVMAGYDGVRGWIDSVCVHPDYRRRGIGARLLLKAERELIRHGCPKVNLQVRSRNADVAKFFEACGFFEEDRQSFGKIILNEHHPPPCPAPPIPVSEKIRLRAHKDSDRASLVQSLNETDRFRRNGGAMPFPYSDFDAHQWLQISHWEDPERNGIRTWAVCDHNDQLIGGVGLTDLVRNQSAEIGYWLRQSFWNHGITTAVVETVCSFAFQEYGLKRIYAQVFADNVASARVLSKAGFQHEGTLRRHAFHDNTVHDVMIFGWLAGEE